MILPIRYVSLENECKQNPELKMSDLQILKDWMYKQPHLPRIDMFYLVFFLHSNYYRLESTKRAIENFFTLRTHFPETFSNRDPVAWKGLRKAFTIAAVVPLEQKTKEGYIMTLSKVLDSDPNEYNPYECAKYLFMTMELQNMIGGTCEGQVLIFDASDMSLGHIVHMNFTFLKKFSYYIQEAAPVRMKAIHILNANPVAHAIVNMCKPFLKAELLKLLHFHTSLATVKEFLPIEALPTEYGGQAGPIEIIAAKHIQTLEENREWFQYFEHIGCVNESLRINKLQNTGNSFGMDGSFKKLEID